MITKLVIASKHNKEKAIAPIANRNGYECVVTSLVDTDSLGTFTGEKERTLLPLEAAKLKCELAIKLENVQAAIATEGSFFPHPSFYGLLMHEEIVYIIDRNKGVEDYFIERTTQTNFGKTNCTQLSEVLTFARQAKFPEHAIILSYKNKDYLQFVKGIDDEETLIKTTENIFKTSNELSIETDMRAMFNPLRMEVIATATEKLFKRLSQACPKCNQPGFDQREVKPGLPCSACGLPTPQIRFFVKKCNYCSFTVNEPSKNHSADPQFCEFCNP